MARNHKHKALKKKIRRGTAPPAFREAIAYMHGVADAVSARPEAGPGPSTNERPTLRYGEVPTQPPVAAPARHRTLPYRSPGGASALASEESSSAPPGIAFESDVLERPSGIHLRVAPLRQEWYELAGAGRRR